jgi:hypothetical protein
VLHSLSLVLNLLSLQCPAHFGAAYDINQSPRHSRVNLDCDVIELQIDLLPREKETREDELRHLRIGRVDEMSMGDGHFLPQ